MSTPSWLPTVLIFFGAILAAVGGLLEKQVRARKDKELGAKADELRTAVDENKTLTAQVAANDAKTNERLKELLARSGNDKELRALIDTRSRLLLTDRRASDNLIDEIIAQAEAKSKDYKKMEEEKSDVVGRRTRNFLLTWEPLLSFVTSEFDRLASRAREKGIPLEISKAEGPLTQTPTNSSYQPRTVRFGDFRIDLQYNNAGIDVNRMDDAYFFVRLIRVSSNRTELEPLTLRVGEQSATCNGKEFRAPTDSTPPKELTDMVQVGIAQAIERMLIASRSDSR
jgi:hypothetical protein